MRPTYTEKVLLFLAPNSDENFDFRVEVSLNWATPAFRVTVGPTKTS
jgi:hypothetical protein